MDTCRHFAVPTTGGHRYHRLEATIRSSHVTHGLHAGLPLLTFRVTRLTCHFFCRLPRITLPDALPHHTHQHLPDLRELFNIAIACSPPRTYCGTRVNPSCIFYHRYRTDYAATTHYTSRHRRAYSPRALILRSILPIYATPVAVSPRLARRGVARALPPTW